MPTTIPPRNKIDKKFTWNDESVFPTDGAWEKEVERIIADVPSIKKFQGRLGESAATLLKAFKTYENLLSRKYIPNMYASFAYSVDTTHQKSAGMRAMASGMVGQVAL